MDDSKRKQDDITLKKLITEYKNGNRDTLAEIFEICESMVIRMSRKYYSITEQRNISIEDLKQEAYIGLLGAVNHFKVQEDNSFVSYAFTAMNYSILVYIRNNSNKIVKTNSKKGFATLTSMDESVNNVTNILYGETLHDDSQEKQFYEIENFIDKSILKKNIQNMLHTIIENDADITVLKDVYGLNGETYSLTEICERNHLTFKELVFKERLMILKIKNSPKLQSYLEKFEYNCKTAYKYSIQRFKDTWTSSTEFLALKHLEIPPNIPYVR